MPTPKQIVAMCRRLPAPFALIDLAELAGVTTTTAHRWVVRLESEGLLKRDAGRARSIRVAGKRR